MASALSEEIPTGVRELIAKITNYETDCDKFKTVERCALTTIKKSDSMYFLNTKDIKRAIWSMADKFMFHGFFKHADYLKQTHDKYIDEKLSESDLTPRLNVVKFLLCMSENPTNYFWKDPDKFNFINETDECDEVVDWGAYLNEGIERWSPTVDDSFHEHSDSDDNSDSCSDTPDGVPSIGTIIRESQEVEQYDFNTCRAELLETIQRGWYNGNVICMRPSSEWTDANVGLLWEEHLKKQVKNLIKIEPITVISEYKVMREVLWQLWEPHISTIFTFNVNELVPKSDVTISSVCSITFEKCIEDFMPYIQVLEEFRQFFRDLESEKVTQTYQSYGCAVRKIIKSVFEELIRVEVEIREQENTMTLLVLAERLHQIFEPVYMLQRIHRGVIFEDFKSRSSLECALTLLTRLRKSLQFPVTKLEQDIRLSLYLESLFYYLTMTNAWLVKNDLCDYSEEFVVFNNNVAFGSNSDRQMNFTLRENTENFEEDGMIKIISDQVLQIGKNIHLLRLLGKYDVFSKGSETIHEEFIRRILEELGNYFGSKIPKSVIKRPEKVKSTFDFNELGDWTNFVDLSDGFLAKAFDECCLENVQTEAEPTLFEKINKITTSLSPLQNQPERIFTQILKERFTISGLMVKNFLIENYYLDKQFEFLNHMFLFWDDLIFPFYRRFFQKMNVANSNWGNSVWLTSHLQDIIFDLYPNFYEDCTVQVKDYWKQCRNSLEACSLISLQYEIKWPLNIIITQEHLSKYSEIFQFILKLKWGLYTVNHLFFTDLMPKNKTRKHPKSKTTIQRLKYLRFNLINVLNNIQHYLFGFVFTKYRIQFELDFEKSNDLKSLISSHDDFIKSIHRSVAEIRDKTIDEQGFNSLLKCVKMLKVMWNELDNATSENLENCHRIYKESFAVINVIVNPVFLFDY